MAVYEIITNRILEQLEKGVCPWQRPWTVEMPQNLISRKAYRVSQYLDAFLDRLQKSLLAYIQTGTGFKGLRQEGGTRKRLGFVRHSPKEYLRKFGWVITIIQSHMREITAFNLNRCLMNNIPQVSK